MMDPIRIGISPGELLDRISILQIKSQRIDDPAKRANVESELAGLLKTRDAALPACPALEDLAGQLGQVNQTLWQVEDQIRSCEAAGDFGQLFIDLARSVYRHNDRRAALKRAVNALLSPAIVEEKSYAAYAKS